MYSIKYGNIHKTKLNTRVKNGYIEYDSCICIHESASIDEQVMIYPNVMIGPQCVIGFEPEIFLAESYEYSVILREGVRLMGLVSIDAGTKKDTLIGARSMLMKGVHVGHDAEIGSIVVMSPGAKIGGHAIIEHECNIGMNAVIHQRVTIPKGCMIGMGAIMPSKKEYQPCRKYVGVAKDIGPNTHKAHLLYQSIGS